MSARHAAAFAFSLPLPSDRPLTINSLLHQNVVRKNNPLGFEHVELLWDHEPAWGATCTAFLNPRSAACLFDTFLVITLPEEDAEWSRGHAALTLIDSARLVVGGQTVESYDAAYHHAHDELALREADREGYREMLGALEYHSTRMLILPLQFFYCGRPSHALPIRELLASGVELHVTFAAQELAQLKAFPKVQLFCTVGEITEAERRSLNAPFRDIVFETPLAFRHDVGGVQTSPDTPLRIEFGKTCNYPVRHLFWTFIADADKGGRDAYKYSNPFGRCRIVLNETYELVDRESDYFYVLEPLFHHTRTPKKPIGAYSFDTHGRNLQKTYASPQTLLAANRLYSCVLELYPKKGETIPPGTMRLYSSTLNVLRIANGFCYKIFA